MTYQTLYRKYRSNDLNELIGQQHIIKTLTNAIAHNRLSHAYIFSGPRGTGKTSTARILAKMVNQTNTDMTLCEICQKITRGTCVDVIEIDAASHTGVDYMRQLIEQVQFLPVEAKYKVFIIDEVHMLSTGAFNALLKTLEEPPEQVLFILATTELHKIPATIQSRAQTLHFRLLDSSVMKDHLANVCSLEGYSIDSKALEKVVNIANGGMRDGLSLLDQLMSVSEDKAINVSDVSMVLGTVDDDQ
ncbi:MAG: DNA polymerase III subunit gamma/tau, partial [Candidatus Margulisiibacteriota bacterium]|nr:DNA polymerase III subunit gamma/tau [Candidatus Margulisiibacteriota bacterium]